LCKQGKQIPFFTSEQRIRSVIISWSPPLIALRGRDLKSTARRQAFASASHSKLKLNTECAAHKLSALGFRSSITCCIHLSSQGARYTPRRSEERRVGK